jgi:thiol-disulfide isomerase/thioredoxin
MSQHIQYVTDATFDPEVLQSSTPVLVDYWAEWCGPCKMIAPILDEVAKGIFRTAQGREAQYRREPIHPAQVRHPRHTHADVVQERRRRGDQGRSPFQITTHRIH